MPGEASHLYLQHALGSDTVPAAVLAIQTYGDQLNFHSHLHSLVAEGGWGRDGGTFQSVSWPNSDILSAILVLLQATVVEGGVFLTKTA